MNTQTFSSLLLIFIFSALNESIMEYFFSGVLVFKPYLRLISLICAVFLTLFYQVNIFEAILGIKSDSPFLDFLLSGFIIARLSNFINDFAGKILGSK